MQLLAQLLTYPELLLGGFLGGVLSVPLQPQIVTLAAKVWAAVTGLCSAVFFTLPVVDHFQLPTVYVGAVAFLLGLFGVSLLMVLIRTLRKADLLGWITQRFGGGS